MIEMLAGWSIGKKIGGAALILAAWLLPAAAVWLHDRGEISAARALGKADCQAANAADLLKANQEAIAEWKAAQSDIAAQAAADASANSRELEAARARVATASKELQAYANAHPLPVDCRADAERVRLLNEARQGGNTSAH
jgi:hypothetical protein